MIERINDQIEEYELEIEQKQDNLNKFRQENLITGDDTSLKAVENRIDLIEKEL